VIERPKSPMNVARITYVMFAWWVFVNLQAVLGPFGTQSQCTDAAAWYSKTHHVEATCQLDN
jgi:hypothetical protein